MNLTYSRALIKLKVAKNS